MNKALASYSKKVLLVPYHGIWLSNVLRRGINPVNSFTGACDYARSAVASWTELCLKTFFVASNEVVINEIKSSTN